MEWELRYKVSVEWTQGNTYMCAYLRKSENICSQAMKHAFWESIKKKQGNYEQMCAAVNVYGSNQERYVEEAVHHYSLKLWLRKIFPGVIHVNTNLAGKRLKMFQSQEETSQLPDESENILKVNMLNRYMNIPNELYYNANYAVLSFCTPCQSKWLATSGNNR